MVGECGAVTIAQCEWVMYRGRGGGDKLCGKRMQRDIWRQATFHLDLEERTGVCQVDWIGEWHPGEQPEQRGRDVKTQLCRGPKHP